MVDNVPTFEFDEDFIAQVKQNLGATDVDLSQDVPISEIRPKRKPGRPRKNLIEEQPHPQSIQDKFPPAPLTKREEREVAARLVSILTGATGMTGMIKPYLPMTEEEAKAIADPLASCLIRNEPTNGIAREILENYDILAMILGVGAYGVRVYSDRKLEVQSQRPANTDAIQRLSERQVQGNGRESLEGAGAQISIPNVSRAGVTPFDV
jgi:hypothetical protein